MNEVKKEKEILIGFIGQGFIGKNYSDDFENRGYEVVRYATEEPYIQNKEKIKDCDIVFIAVPTPTIPAGKLRDDGKPAVLFYDKIVKDVVSLASDGAIVVIKSTIKPGTAVSIQEQHPNKIILHSPEFLKETTAAYDAANPQRNIIGTAKDNETYRSAAGKVLSILPKAPFELICDSQTAEFIKYANNAFLASKIIFANIFYELVNEYGADWETVRKAIGADPRIGPSHLDLHLEGDAPKIMRRRGAGRSCFIKDFATLSEMYAEAFPEDKNGIAVFRGFEYKNSEFLREFDRYVDLLEGVYGEGAGIKDKKTSG